MAVEGNSYRVATTARTILYAVLIATVALFSIGSIYFFTRIQDQERAITDRANAAMWLATSLEREHWKLVNVLAQHIRLADSGDTVLLQYEVLWSRLIVLAEGIEGQPLRSLPGYQMMTDTVSGVLEEVEPDFQALEQSGRALSIGVLEKLQALSAPIHDFLITVHLQKAWRADLSARLLVTQRTVLYACFGGIAISGAALLILLFQHVRIARRLLNSLNQALAEAERKTEALKSEMAQREHAERELKKANNELVLKQQVLEQSNAELREYSHIIAHDLKEPLRGISVYNALLLEGYSDRLDGSARDMLGYQSRMVRQLDAVIESLQDYSRFAVNDEINRTEVALDEVLEQIVESLEVLIKERDVEICRVNRLPTIRCDRVLVAEVLRNLLVNAINYNDSSPIQIEIGSKATSDGTQMIFVKDNGIGVEAKHSEVIFRLFKRLHGKDEYGGGTGYGLTLCRKIVRRHGGRIWVNSEPGEGSCFCFTLSAPQV